MAGVGTMVVLLLQHKDVVKPVVVNEGLEPHSFAALLRALFPTLKEHKQLVGLRHSHQVHFGSIALVCATPQNFTDRVYFIVTADDDDGHAHGGELAAPATSSNSAGPAETIVNIGDSSAALHIHQHHVDILNRFFQVTGLQSVTCMDMFRVFPELVEEEDATIGKQEYFDSIDALLKSDDGKSPRARDKLFFSRVFDTIFDAFDHERSGTPAACAGPQRHCRCALS